MGSDPHGFDGWMRDESRRLRMLERSAGAARARVSSADVTVSAAGMAGTVRAVKQGAFVVLTGTFTGTPSAAMPLTLCVLPDGFRPADSGKWRVGSGTTTSTGERLVSVSTSGVVTLISATGVGTGVMLTGVTFVKA